MPANTSTASDGPGASSRCSAPALPGATAGRTARGAIGRPPPPPPNPDASAARNLPLMSDVYGVRGEGSRLRLGPINSH